MYAYVCVCVWLHLRAQGHAMGSVLFVKVVGPNLVADELAALPGAAGVPEDPTEPSGWSQ